MTTYSTAARREMMRVYGTDPLLELLAIDHPALAEPARFVQDTDDLISNGELFRAARFSLTPPDSSSQGAPRATLSVSNIGRELVQWLEWSNGGSGATCRIMQVRRSQPDLVEYDTTLWLTRLRLDAQIVSGELGYPDLHNMLGVMVVYDQRTAPGLF